MPGPPISVSTESSESATSSRKCFEKSATVCFECFVVPCIDVLVSPFSQR